MSHEYVTMNTRLNFSLHTALLLLLEWVEVLVLQYWTIRSTLSYASSVIVISRLQTIIVRSGIQVWIFEQFFP